MGDSEAQCEVWWAPVGAADGGLVPLLDAAERGRHTRFRLSADRDRYLVAHALARLVCARAAGCAAAEVEFTHHCVHCDRPDGHGKPRPGGAAHGVEMSLSHAGEWVVVAARRGAAVGVDVEQVRVRSAADTDGLADYVLTESELADWRRLDADARPGGFFTYWARKEALLKATGEGVSGVRSVSVTAPDRAAAVVDWRGAHAPAAVHLQDLAVTGDYRAALATIGADPARAVHRDATALLRTAAGHEP